MKEWLLLVVILIATFFAFSYLFIPDNIVVSKSFVVKANVDAVVRNLQSNSSWRQWWPGTIHNEKENLFAWDIDNVFQIKKNSFRSVTINGSFKGDSCASFLSCHPTTANDSVIVTWQTAFVASKKPITRIREYFFAKRIERIFSSTLPSLNHYLADIKHLYGFDFKEETVSFEFLLSTQTAFNHSPNIIEVYAIVDRLHSFYNSSCHPY